MTAAQGQEGKYIHFRGLVDYASIHFRGARDRVSYKSYFYYIFRPEALFVRKLFRRRRLMFYKMMKLSSLFASQNRRLCFPASL